MGLLVFGQIADTMFSITLERFTQVHECFFVPYLSADGSGGLTRRRLLSYLGVHEVIVSVQAPVGADGGC